MKILVTGGAGYIGSHTIVELLRNNEHEIISIDNFYNSHPWIVDRIEKITGKKIINYPVDLADIIATRKVFQENKDIKGVIHFAALKSVEESQKTPLLYLRNNCNALYNLLELSVEFEVKHFIFSSSCTVYGSIDKLPVSESTPLNKTESVYGFTKLIGERALESVCNSSDLQGVALRYFNPVGADDTGLIGELALGKPTNLVPVITQTAAGITDGFTVFGNSYNTRDGSCIRDYIHVSDIALAHVKALNYSINNGFNYDVFNLGSGKGVSVFELIASFEKMAGIKLNYKIGERRLGDIEAIYSDSSKAFNVLSWKAEKSIDDMMASAWKWQQNVGELALK
jgi:UDP-glucose 4-epimerase